MEPCKTGRRSKDNISIVMPSVHHHVTIKLSRIVHLKYTTILRICHLHTVQPLFFIRQCHHVAAFALVKEHRVCFYCPSPPPRSFPFLFPLLCPLPSRREPARLPASRRPPAAVSPSDARPSCMWRLTLTAEVDLGR